MSAPAPADTDQRVHLFGVRHHGPGSARSLVRALHEVQPDVVLVELPGDVGDALVWLDHADLVPPVALLGYVRDQPQRAVFLPFAEFSPEWQALRWARHHGVPVRPVDEPLALSMADRPDGGASDRHPPRDPLAELAAAAGEVDPERWWDDVVEHRGEGRATFTAVAEAMTALREGWEPDAGEARREAAMRQGLRRALADGFQRVAVVCGAWHVPAFGSPDGRLPPVSADAARLRGQPKVKVEVTWAPWTSRRLAARTGYGAGVASPAWYQHVFEHPGPDSVARWFVDAGRLLRSRRMGASPDHLIAGARLADTLAALRDRPRPGLDEVVDAATAVLGEGGAAAMALVRDELVVGRSLGRVPDDAPLVPLARDLAAEQRRLRLKPAAEAKEVELDLRTPTGLGRSRLLHRLGAIELGWATRVDGRGSSGTFRETWRLQWEPELSVRLIELAAHGTTVAAAATTCLVERADAASTLTELVAVLDRALLADLPDAIEPCVARLAERAARNHDAGELMDVLGPLARAARYGDVRSTDTDSLRSVFDASVARVLAELAPTAMVALDDAAAATMAERLSSTQAALALLDHPARVDRWPAVLARLASPDDRVHGLVHGRATRLLHDAGAWTPTLVAARLGQALGPGTPPAAGAAFVEGFLSGAGTVLVHDATLLASLDDWLAQLPADAFLTTVPLLRRTFGAFEPGERRQLAELVRSGPAGSDVTGIGTGHDLDPARVSAAMHTVRLLLGIDAGAAP